MACAVCTSISKWLALDWEGPRCCKASCSELFQSAQDGCHTCQALKQAVLSFYSVDDPSRYVIYWWGIECRKTGGKSDMGAVENPSFYVQLALLSLPLRTQKAKLLDLYKGEYDRPYAWPSLDAGASAPQSTASDVSHFWAVSQLQRCLGQHQSCGAGPRSPQLPTRVLDLGSNSIKVLETHGQRGEYIALSHCWGDPKLMPTKLTAHTLAAYKEQIPYNSLPRTFQDAVTFTRKTNVRYLWIDSLCIIQVDHDKDSDEDKKLSIQDWRQESGRMCDVFRNSLLTLAALSATDCTGGLFFPSKTWELQVATPDGPHSLFAREWHDHMLDQHPLLQRGWVAQEYLLSPRTLLFGASELLWQCLEDRSCQCTGSGHPTWRNFGYSKLPPEIDQESTQATRSELMRSWHRIVSAYSQTYLSFQTDKLEAIDGIAQYMRPLRSGGYLAGLWSDSLPYDLLWNAEGDRHRTIEPDTMKRSRAVWSSDQHLFPTWSWASVRK